MENPNAGKKILIIEDDVFLGPGGPKILTRFTRELIELG